MFLIRDFLAIRYSKELAGHFGIKVGQLELLGAMNIGILNEMVASSSNFGNPALEADDEDEVKYISAPETNLVKRIAYGEMVSTNASRLQSRIWRSYVCIIFSLLNVNSKVVQCRSKPKNKTEMLMGLNTSLRTQKCLANLTDYS